MAVRYDSVFGDDYAAAEPFLPPAPIKDQDNNDAWGGAPVDLRWSERKSDGALKEQQDNERAPRAPVRNVYHQPLP